MIIRTTLLSMTVFHLRISRQVACIDVRLCIGKVVFLDFTANIIGCRCRCWCGEVARQRQSDASRHLLMSKLHAIELVAQTKRSGLFWVTATPFPPPKKVPLGGNYIRTYISFCLLLHCHCHHTRSIPNVEADWILKTFVHMKYDTCIYRYVYMGKYLTNQPSSQTDKQKVAF